MSISHFSIRGEPMREKAVFTQVHRLASDEALFGCQGPGFQVAGGAQEGYLAAFEFEGYIL